MVYVPSWIAGTTECNLVTMALRDKMKKKEILKILRQELIEDIDYKFLFDYDKPDFRIWR